MVTANPNLRPKWDVHNPHSMAGQRFVTTIRKVYNPIGFKKGYNFPLFIIGVGGLMGFTLSRMFYWNINGIFAKVGDSSIAFSRHAEFYFRMPYLASGITIELAVTASDSYYI